MDEKLCFVQFLHPGGEHGPDGGSIKGWNRKAHKRKFLVGPGRYIAGDKLLAGEIEFWGEWEPESRVKAIADPIPHGPHFVYEPYYVMPKSYAKLQNTDPFVFGKQFHYTVCQQRTEISATQLRYLKQGSVILFGSRVQDSFVLDTVFVVDRWIDYNRNNCEKKLKEAISPEYKQVTISALFHEHSERKFCTPAGQQESLRLYFGASYKKPLGDMYSFFPSQPHKDGSKGFARPTIKLPGKVTDNQSQKYKLTPCSNLDDISQLWQEVVEQVRTQGLALGVYAEMPKRH
jgi:hypothetical protein